MTRGRSAPLVVLLCASLVATALGVHDFGLGAHETYQHISGGGDASMFDVISNSHVTGRSGGDKDKRITVSWQYTVPPSRHETFTKAWKDIIEAGTEKEKGDQVVDLKKTAIDNVFFVSYGEWDSWEAFRDHLETDYFRKWVDWVKTHDIKYTFKWLEPLGDVKHSKHALGRGGHTSNPWTVLSAIYVKPSAADEFVGAWNSVADGVDKERGNHIYSLRRVASTNSEFWIYGSWESKADFEDHLKSDYVRKLGEFIIKKDVIAVIAPLIKLGDQPE